VADHARANSATWKLTSLREMARAQLGTVGSGNHYVDIFEDEQGRIWVGAHFGSRGFGHKIAARFLNRAGANDDMDSAPVALDSRTQEGQDYIAAMMLAGRYPYAGRDWVCDRVILEGVENRQASSSLYSTIHGAGCVMGRMEAKGKRDKAGEWKRPPKVT
jgi:tRNA-splicing ligase RtcB (3'-phosphate/5'-hydroxy nucleic acid ligase)